VYPRAVAGTPTAYGFDVRTGRFHLSYVARHGTHGPTVITVPNTVHYPMATGSAPAAPRPVLLPCTS
jgi:hypothetical protein